MIIYPAVDIKNGQCVRLKQGLADQATTYFPDPAAPAQAFAADGSTWIHVVDLDGAFDGTPRNLSTLQRIAETGLRIQFGGGLRDADSIQAALAAGASRVILGTKATADEDFVSRMVRQHGEKIAVGIDAKNGLVAIKGWVEVTELRATTFAARMAGLGVRTIIYTDIATDGMLQGPNFSALEEILDATPANIIASGGVSRREDILRLKEIAEQHANLDGAIVGKALYEKRVLLTDLLHIAGPR